MICGRNKGGPRRGRARGQSTLVGQSIARAKNFARRSDCGPFGPTRFPFLRDGLKWDEDGLPGSAGNRRPQQGGGITAFRAVIAPKLRERRRYHSRGPPYNRSLIRDLGINALNQE